ncbi:hypothetical protein PSQ39_06570 [Curvibacter sp. HBC28]|uniref:Carbohydrate-binding protein n=1 Tax=Curvibacter microcysteis TaxID=3026419 RepID=A0ABT5MGJ2_9BURK|nr:hypothetical protein [Curvibacter sp. HBC28]MDD0814290.1 hypothetical protein [Curvibacter sp. HBC28]
MNILIPLQITDSMLASCTVAEPAAGETAWAAGTFAIGDRRIRTSTHRIYECVAAVSGSTPPENDPTHWLDAGPTARWAAMDTYISTQTTATTSVSFVLRPGFFDAVALYGLTGTTLQITLKDAPGGTVVKSATVLLEEDPLDWWDWAFGPRRALTKFFLKGLTPYADPELTITVSSGTGEPVGIGMIVVGSLTPMVDSSTWGGTQQGASASPQTFSYIKVDEFGNTSIVKRRAATDMQFKVAMPRERADYALALVQRVLDVPAAWIATDATGYQGLNVFGLGSGSMSYDSFGMATFSGSVKGMA